MNRILNVRALTAATIVVLLLLAVACGTDDGGTDTVPAPSPEAPAASEVPTVVEAEPAPETEPDSEAQPASETEPAPGADSDTEAQPDSETGSSPEPTSAPGTDPDAETPPVSEAQPLAETSPVSFEGVAEGTAPQFAQGQAVPAFSGTDINGAPFTWTPGAAPTVMVFLAHWCPACQAEVTELTEWLESGNRLPDGVEFFGVSTLVNPERDNYPPSQWLREEGLPIPVLLDDDASSMAEAFGLTGTPFWAIIDGGGVLAGTGSGRIPPAELVGVFDQLLAASQG